LSLAQSLPECNHSSSPSTQPLIPRWNGTFGCCGIRSTGIYRWRPFLVGDRCSFRLSNLNIYYVGSALYLKQGLGTVLATWVRGSSANNSVITGTNLWFEFNATTSDNCDTRFTIQYNCTNGTDSHLIYSGQPYTFRYDGNSTNGFEYFILDPLVSQSGTSLDIQAMVLDYRGLSPPAFFIAKDFLPSLEQYNYTNTTYPEGGVFRFKEYLLVPQHGQWVIGMFSYGRFSEVHLKVKWAYNLTSLQNDQTLSVVLRPSNPWVRQVQLDPMVNRDIEFEYSRAQPGGQTTFLVGNGYIPTLSHYLVKKSTQDGSFGEIAFPTPIGTGNNPGQFIIKALTNDTQAGFLLKASWKG